MSPANIFLMNANDIAQLRELFAEQDKKFIVALKQNNQDLKVEIRDEVHSLIAAAEKRIINTIVGSIGEILDAAVLPQITELQREITVIKQHLQLA